jgi:hypothetical protein
MYNLSHRLAIAISVSILGIGSSDPVLAQPQPKTVTVSQTGNKAQAPDDIARPPIDAILANLKPKLSPQTKVVRFPQHQRGEQRSLAKTTHPIRLKPADRSRQNIANFVDTDRDPHPSAVDRLIK